MNKPDHLEPEPTPLFGEPREPGCRPGLRVPVLENAIVAISLRTKAPEEIAFQCVLATAAQSAQGHVDVQTLGGRAPVSLSLLTIAKSGERKSQCDGLATSELKKIERRRLAAYQRQRAEYEQSSVKGDPCDVLEDDSRGLRTAAPERPIDPTIHLGDATIESILCHFDRGNPSVSIRNDEGGQILGGHSMKRENKLKASAAFSKLWDGRSIDRHRAGTGSSTYFGRRLSTHLMIQPGMAQDLLSDPVLLDQGLLSRQLTVWPKSRIGDRIYKDKKEPGEIRAHTREMLADYDRAVAELSEFPLPSSPGNPLELQPRLLDLSEGGQHVAIDFYNRVELGQREDGPFEHIDGFASKLPEQACRIAGILEFWRDHDATEVSEDLMINAVELAEYYLDEMLRIRECGYGSMELRSAARLGRWLRKERLGAKVSSREIQGRGPSPRLNAQQVLRAMDILERHGWVFRLHGDAEIDGRRVKHGWRVTKWAYPT